MLVTLFAALALQTAPAPTGPITTTLRPAQAIERIVADCMTNGNTVEEVTSIIVKCRYTNEQSLGLAQAMATVKYLRSPRVTPDRATYLATYNVAPRTGGSMATVSVSLEVPSSSGVLTERSDGMTTSVTQLLGEMLTR